MTEILLAYLLPPLRQIYVSILWLDSFWMMNWSMLVLTRFHVIEALPIKRFYKDRNWWWSEHARSDEYSRYDRDISTKLYQISDACEKNLALSWWKKTHFWLVNFGRFSSNSIAKSIYLNSTSDFVKGVRNSNPTRHTINLWM